MNKGKYIKLCHDNDIPLFSQHYWLDAVCGEEHWDVIIIEENGKYEMRVRNDYLPKVKQFAQEMEISKNALRTLAYISKHDGMLKSELAKRIGPQIYQDVQELVENEFITTKKAGRTAKLFVTEKFKRHFSIANQQ